MSSLKSNAGRIVKPIKSYAEFWAWFQDNEKMFFDVVKNQDQIEKKFFDRLSSKLEELKEGYLYLTGMPDDNTVELIITADGNIKNIVFVEELVQSAPKIDGWRFTALKPASDIEDLIIEIGGYTLNDESISFYTNEWPGYPDEIDIAIVYDHLTEKNKAQVSKGIHLFLDNYLGELDFATSIDNLTILGKREAQKGLIPISKLKAFLTWKQKEFIEKYEGTYYNTENGNYSIFEAKNKSNKVLLATINTELLNWDKKASHPWICILTLKYDGRNNNGMPNTNDYKLLNNIEEEIMQELKDGDGYLNIGRQTADGEREIYFACKDFRKPSKIFFKVQNKYSDFFEIGYDIYKDKYWRSFERFAH